MEDIFARFKRESKPEMVKNPVINEETIRNLVDTCILVDKGSKEAISGHAHQAVKRLGALSNYFLAGVLCHFSMDRNISSGAKRPRTGE